MISAKHYQKACLKFRLYYFIQLIINKQLKIFIIAVIAIINFNNITLRNYKNHYNAFHKNNTVCKHNIKHSTLTTQDFYYG